MPSTTTEVTHGEGKRLAYYMDRLIVREISGCAPSCCCCFFSDIRAQVQELESVMEKLRRVDDKADLASVEQLLAPYSEGKKWRNKVVKRGLKIFKKKKDLPKRPKPGMRGDSVVVMGTFGCAGGGCAGGGCAGGGCNGGGGCDGGCGCGCGCG